MFDPRGVCDANDVIIIVYVDYVLPSVRGNHRSAGLQLTGDGGGNTYRSGGNGSVTVAGAVHAHITTTPVGVSPSIHCA